MPAFLIIILAVLGWSSPALTDLGEPTSQEPLTVYYFIRHAEKDTSDLKDPNPELTTVGLERAKKWAEIFKEVPFDMIYSTDYQRTRQTASAVAKTKGLEIKYYNPESPIKPSFLENTKGKTVLVVGHSNTNPAFVNALLGETKYQDLKESEYGSLFIVTRAPSGQVSSQVLYIN